MEGGHKLQVIIEKLLYRYITRFKISQYLAHSWGPVLSDWLSLWTGLQKFVFIFVFIYVIDGQFSITSPQNKYGRL